MTDLQRRVLARFADRSERSGNACSKLEAIGSDAAALSAATDALVELGHLKPLPTAETCDEHGGTRFKLTDAGWAALGRTPGTPAPKPAPAVRTVYGPPGAVVPSANGKHRKGA